MIFHGCKQIKSAQIPQKDSLKEMLDHHILHIHILLSFNCHNSIK